jgi:hypothetical protein
MNMEYSEKSNSQIQKGEWRLPGFQGRGDAGWGDSSIVMDFQFYKMKK